MRGRTVEDLMRNIYWREKVCGWRWVFENLKVHRKDFSSDYSEFVCRNAKEAKV